MISMNIKLSRELIILIVGRVLQILISLVTIKISTKILDVNEMGNLYLILTITSFFGLFFINPIGQYINRKTHEWYSESKLLDIFYIYNLYILFLSFISVGIITLLYKFGVANEIEWILLVSLIFVYIYFNTWHKTIIPMINMLEGRIAFVIFTILTQIFSFVFAYIAINIFDKNGVYWFLGQTMALVVLSFVSLLYFILKIQNNFNLKKSMSLITIKSIKNIMNFSLPLSFGVLFLWMQTQSYGIIIEKNIGSEFLGYLGVGLAISAAITGSFETIIMQYFYPTMYKSMNNEVEFSIMISKIINLILPLYLLLAIFVTYFAQYLTIILVDEKFHESYIYLIFAIWIAFFRMSSNMISNIAHAKLTTKKLILPYMIGGICAVVGVVLATQSSYYKIYIPLALLISNILSFFVMYIEMNNLLRIKLDLKNFYLVLFYTLPFSIIVFFYSYDISYFYSVLLVFIFGIYFLFILYKLFIRKEKS